MASRHLTRLSVTVPGSPLPTRRPNPTRGLLRILVFSFGVLLGTSFHGFLSVEAGLCACPRARPREAGGGVPT